MRRFETCYVGRDKPRVVQHLKRRTGDEKLLQLPASLGLISVVRTLGVVHDNDSEFVLGRLLPTESRVCREGSSDEELPLGNILAIIDAIYERYIQIKLDGTFTK